MRKLVLTLLILPLSLPLFATHITGGELKLWTDTVNGSFGIWAELRVVRDVNGVALGQTQSLTVEQANSTFSLTVNKQFPVAVIPPPAALGTNAQYEIHVYKGFQPLTNSTDRIVAFWFSCCRPVGIDNIPFSNGKAYHIQAELELNMGWNSELPVVLPMAAYVNVNSPFSIANFTQDPEGDSLFFSLQTPLGDTAAPIPGYTLPWDSVNNPVPFSINASSGLVVGNAMSISVQAYRIQIEEYRFDSSSNQYALLAIHNKDLAIRSVASGISLTPKMAPIANGTTLANGAVAVDFIGDQNNLLQLSFSDIKTSKFSISVYGGPFEFDAQNTTITKDSLSDSTCNFNLEWNVAQQYAQNGSYFFVVRTDHYGFVNDYLLAIRVPTSVGVQEDISALDFRLYPNPAENRLQISSDRHWERIEIIDFTGKRVFQSGFADSFNVEALPSGVYFLKAIHGDDIHVERFVKK